MHKKILQNPSEMIQKSIKNRPTSFKIGPKRPLGGVLGGFGGVLGGSLCLFGSERDPKSFKNLSKNHPNRSREGLWAILAPRWFQDGSNCEKVADRTPTGPPWTPQAGGQNRPKSCKNRSKSHSKINQFFDHCFDRFLIDFGAILGGFWDSKSRLFGPKIDRRGHPREPC